MPTSRTPPSLLELGRTSGQMKSAPSMIGDMVYALKDGGIVQGSDAALYSFGKQ